MTESIFSEFPATLTPKNLTLTKGKTLFKQGDDVSNIYHIKSGRVKLIRNSIDGTPVVLHVAQAGESVAGASLFSSQYHCTAIADQDCEVVLVTKDSLLTFLKKKPCRNEKPASTICPSGQGFKKHKRD